MVHLISKCTLFAAVWESEWRQTWKHLINRHWTILIFLKRHPKYPADKTEKSKYALSCPKPWKKQQLKCHSWNLSRLRYPLGGCHNTAAMQCSELAVGWSFSSTIPAISQKSSLRRKYCKGELASCLDYLLWAWHTWNYMTQHQHLNLLEGNMQCWWDCLNFPHLPWKLASSLLPGTLGEVAGSNK